MTAVTHEDEDRVIIIQADTRIKYETFSTMYRFFYFHYENSLIISFL
jgi:hypothetical protein